MEDVLQVLDNIRKETGAPPELKHSGKCQDDEYLEAGLFQFLGTNGLTISYRNPATTGIVSVETNGQMFNNEAAAFVGRERTRAFMSDSPGNEFTVTLASPRLAFAPTHYGLMHDANIGYSLRWWELLASTDGESWDMLKLHANDASLSGPFAKNIWSLVVPEGKSYTSFKVRMTGPNSHGNHHLACSGFEMYGKFSTSDGLPGVKASVDATLQDIADAHWTRVKTIEKQLDEIIIEEDKKCKEAEDNLVTTVAKLEAGVDKAYLHKNERLAAKRKCLAVANQKARAAAELANSFRPRIAAATVSIESLSIDEVFELLLMLRAGSPPIAKSLLKAQDVRGSVLADLTEREMRKVLGIQKLGYRRRLYQGIQRVANGHGFQPLVDEKTTATAGWDASRVCQWLQDEGLEKYEEQFRKNDINGIVLLSLTRDDIEHLGVDTLGEKAMLMNKIKMIQQQ